MVKLRIKCFRREARDKEEGMHLKRNLKVIIETTNKPVLCTAACKGRSNEPEALHAKGGNFRPWVRREPASQGLVSHRIKRGVSRVGKKAKVKNWGRISGKEIKEQPAKRAEKKEGGKNHRMKCSEDLIETKKTRRKRQLSLS